MIAKTKKTPISILRADVKLSDIEILHRYLGIKDVPCVIQSPLRDDDSTPSFSLFEGRDGLFWKDFGTGESGNVIKLFARLWNVEYNEALLKIKLDTESRIPRASLIRKYNGKIHLTSDSSIKIRTREWKEWDTEFWSSFGISKKFCMACNVYPVSHAFFSRNNPDGRKTEVCVPMDKHAYAYIEWKDGNQSIKLYQPFSSTMKWLSKNDASVWDLWKQAFMFAEKKSNKRVILTSSRKDAMCLWENLKVPAMSLQGEGYLPKPHVMQQVFDRFEKVYLWYDNDFKHKDKNPGQDNAAKLIALYPNLINICIPESYQSKDPSDLFKNHGKEALKQIFNEQK